MSPFALFQKTFPQGSHIDILFISHFDADHISGIEDILNDQLKNVHQPKWIDDKTYVFIPIKNYRIISLIAQVNPLYQQINTIIELLLQSGAHIISVWNNKPNANGGVESTNFNDLGNKTQVSNGATIKVSAYWYYTLYVTDHPRSDYLDKFLKKLQKLGYTEQQINDGKLNLQNKNVFEKIKKCATEKNGKKMNGSSINMHSLQVLSFPANETTKSQLKYKTLFLKDFIKKNHLSITCHIKITPIRGVRNISCLYTGDNDLSKGAAYCDEMYFMLSTLFNFSRINQIGLMQIPHHGSVHNTSRLLPYDGNVGRLFVNVAFNLAGCLFDKAMIASLLKTRKRYFVITETPISELVMEATL